MTERRYDEGEVRRILESASRASVEPRHDPPDGMSLAELQSVASEAGVSPEAVARAAAALDSPATERRTTLGMPIEVGRSTNLPRNLTDGEWERLVAELRTTFRARGRVAASGGLREWSNGRLHACVEPTATGYRLRMGTVKSDAIGFNALGGIGIVTGAIVMGSSAISGELAGGLWLSTILGASGVAALAANLLRLPRWADLRARQMQHIERTALALVASPDPPTASS